MEFKEASCNHKPKNDCCCFIAKIATLLSVFALLLLFFLAIFVFQNQPTVQELRGLQLQYQGGALILENEDPIIFDTTINNAITGVTYDSTTGEITVTETGLYYINWWVATDGSTVEPTIDLAIVTSSGETIISSNPILSGQMSGNALLSITATEANPVTIRLINITGNDVFLGPTTVGADLTIMRVS